jgi:hypothetical protein
MKKLTLVLFLSITTLTTAFAFNSFNSVTHNYSVNRLVTQDEIALYIFENYRETVISSEPIEDSENMLAYTANGKVFMIIIENGIIITNNELPAN